MTSEWTEEVTLRVSTFGRVLLAIGIDLLFLAGVVVLNWMAQEWVFERFELHGSARFSLVVLEWSVTIATLATVLGYLFHDTAIAVLRPWRDSKDSADRSPSTGTP